MTETRSGALASSDTARATSPGFSALALHPTLLAAIERMGFSAPTPIQLAAIPPALEGRDLLATAMTGSGKTAAFLLPIVQRLLVERDGKTSDASLPSGGNKTSATRALILTPTRELAAQIVEHLKGLAAGTGIRGAAIFGGVSMGPQEQAFRKGFEILVATPGRLLDHFQNPYARLPELDFFVLDEADRMLDMGFLPEIRRILGHLPKRRRQTLLFSATMPDPIAKLAGEMLQNPVEVKTQTKQAPPSAITQHLYPVAGDLKVDLLVELHTRKVVGSAIVFCRTKHRAKRLAQKLAKRGIPAAEIHGNRSQKQRIEALEGFKKGRFIFLVATDIVARGIDVHALGHVVNFDVPVAPEDYIHRIGRTARAEATGEAHTFFAPDEEKEVAAIERALRGRIPRTKLEEFDYTAKSDEAFEIPLAERIAAIRARKKEERERAKVNAERRAARQNGGGTQGNARSGASKQGGSQGGSGGQSRSGTGSRSSGAPASSSNGSGRPGGTGGRNGRAGWNRRGGGPARPKNPPPR